MESRLKEALTNPSHVYAHPEDVLKDSSLDKNQKREVLLRWQADAIHLQESVGEGFGGGERSQLDDVNKALEQLDRPAS